MTGVSIPYRARTRDAMKARAVDVEESIVRNANLSFRWPHHGDSKQSRNLFARAPPAGAGSLS